MSTERFAIGSIRSAAEIAAEVETQRQQRRAAHLTEQQSESNPPEMRIRTWEKLHGLQLPCEPDHPVLMVVASSTRLTLAEVRREQHLRAERIAQAGQKSSGGSPPVT